MLRAGEVAPYAPRLATKTQNGPVSTKLIVAGFVGVAIVAGSTAGVGSYLATKSSMPTSASSPPRAAASTSETAAPAATVETPSTSSSPLQVPPSVSTPTPTSEVASPRSSPQSQMPVPTKTPKTTPKPARTTPKPIRTTPQAEVCVPDPTWSARQERNRIAREAQTHNYNVEINMAINRGDMDEATRLQDEFSALQQSWAEDDALDPQPKC